MTDKSFQPDKEDLLHGIELLLNFTGISTDNSTPVDQSVSPSDNDSPNRAFAQTLPETGIGERATIDCLAPIVLGGAARLGSPTAFAHMDPPTPWITWMAQCWNASLNQNLLHPDVSPVAGQLESQLLQWLTPYFGMSGGHLTPGSTVSNLTALWAARDLQGVRRVVASSSAHISIDKAARILGLELVKVPSNKLGQLDTAQLPACLTDAVLVLTAGTTSEGAVDPLELVGQAAWTHVDAAWAGPLRFSDKHAPVLAGIEQADSIAVSAHKWLYQPKECGVLMFKDVSSANEVLSVSGAYLSRPNVGLLGSHGANAIPLLATLIAWGRHGLAQRIDAGMNHADALTQFLRQQRGVRVYGDNISGVVLWQSSEQTSEEIVQALPSGAASITNVCDSSWVRHVSANPNIDIDALNRDIGLVLNG